MTTSADLAAAELHEALLNARIAHKKAALGIDRRALTATRDYLHALENQYDELCDRIPEQLVSQDNTFDLSDLRHGYHLVTHPRSGS